MSKVISKIVVPDSSELTGYALYNVKDANAIPASEKGAASGVATLDNTGKIPSSQIPSGIISLLSDWNQTDSTAGDYIKNKPTSMPASDVSAWAKASSKPSYTKDEIGLSNVTNDAQVKRSEMGVASGVATLDSAGKVPSSQLPSYVDDVVEYDTKPAFPATGEGGKIYIDKSNDTSWRWSGSTYTQIKGDLTIGTTSGTAADGKIVNDHINNTSNPHSVTKAQVGLGSVVNTGDSATPVSGGTTKFTTGGAYTELAKKVDKVTGKGLSTNDYTTDEKNKLAGIETGATKVTTLDDVSDGSTRKLSNYLPLSGGTITGNLKIECTNVDASKADNNVSSTIWPTTFNVTDKSDRILTRKEAIIESNGNISAYWYVRNYNTSGKQLGQKGIKITMNKSGNTTYTVDEAANFRSAIGAGTSSFSGSYNDLSNKPTNENQGNGIGTCSTSSGTALTVSLTGYELVQNGFVAVTFENDVPASATLNINGKGAKPIIYKGSAIEADTIKANDTVTFAYDGTNYVVTSLGSGGGSDWKGTIIVNLEAYDDGVKILKDFDGVEVTLTNTTDSETETKTVVSGDTSVTFLGLVPLKNYTISISDITGYITPIDQYAPNIDIGAIISKTFRYDNIQYAYVTIDQTQSSELSKITVTKELGGTAQHLNQSTGKHENLALQQLRDSSHLYLGKFSNSKMTLKQLKDDEGTKYLDGTDATMDGSQGDHFLRIGLPFYIKRVNGSDNGNQVTYGICVGYKPDNTWKQIIKPENLLGVHMGYVSSTSLYSRSGTQIMSGVYQGTAKTYARNRGTGYTCCTYEWHCIMMLLFWAWYGRTSFKAQCGSGKNPTTRIMGIKDFMGMRDTDSTNGNTDSTKFWGIEDWNTATWIDNATTTDRVYTITDVWSGGTRVISTPQTTQESYITRLLLSEHLDPIVTAASGGSATTYYCDFCQYNDGYRPAYHEWLHCLSCTKGWEGAGLDQYARLAYNGNIEIV